MVFLAVFYIFVDNFTVLMHAGICITVLMLAIISFTIIIFYTIIILF